MKQSPIMAALTWLHLSDLQACQPRSGWDAGRIAETLVQGLAGLQRDHDLRPDLIFFTGDPPSGTSVARRASRSKSSSAKPGRFSTP